LDEHPELLRLVPKRWRGNPVVLAALTGVGVLLAGCSRDRITAADSRIAPVFIHGEGRGAFGCKAVNPPVFLSEGEARQVIAEEAKRGGIDFAPDRTMLDDVLMPAWDLATQNGKTQERPLVLDGEDRGRKIAYEFVSTEDLRVWQEPHRSTAYSYDTAKSARELRDRIAESRTEESVAVFYDPLVRPTIPRDPSGKADWANYRRDEGPARQEARENSKEQLRAQVRDFIKWLKAQGVI
jgi:hypothetical protein